MSYAVAKYIHIVCVALSGSLFLLRGIWTWRHAAILRARWMRFLPHVIDTVLLASAVTMVILSAQYPFVQSWLTAKVIALVAYIALGSVALKSAKRKSVRIWAFVAALAMFTYIVGVAITKHVLIVS
ncbi:MAG: SirB2 family protein [Betaproteobacteria bacterium]